MCKPKLDTEYTINADAGFHGDPGMGRAEWSAILSAKFLWTLGQTGNCTSSSPSPVIFWGHQHVLVLMPNLSIPHSSHFLLHRTRAQVKGNMEFWDLAALSLVNLRESQSRLILLVGMEKAPHFKICCLHLTKMFRGFKKWMPKENWDELLEFVCTFHRGMKVLNAGTSTLTFFTVTPVTHFSNLNPLVLEVHLDISPTS